MRRALTLLSSWSVSKLSVKLLISKRRKQDVSLPPSPAVFFFAYFLEVLLATILFTDDQFCCAPQVHSFRI